MILGKNPFFMAFLSHFKLILVKINLHRGNPTHKCTKSFKLMALQNITVEEALPSKSASVTMKQTSHPV